MELCNTFSRTSSPEFIFSLQIELHRGKSKRCVAQFLHPHQTTPKFFGTTTMRTWDNHFNYFLNINIMNLFSKLNMSGSKISVRFSESVFNDNLWRYYITTVRLKFKQVWKIRKFIFKRKWEKYTYGVVFFFFEGFAKGIIRYYCGAKGCTESFEKMKKYGDSS